MSKFFVEKCQGISLEAAVEFQKCFAFSQKSSGQLFYDSRQVDVDNQYSPFHLIPHEEIPYHFALSIVGEMGTAMDDFIKTFRRQLRHGFKVADEAGDVFIYFLIFIMILDQNNKGGKKFLKILGRLWDKDTGKITGLSQLHKEYSELTQRILRLTDRQYRKPEEIAKIFRLLKRWAEYVSGLSWQQIVDHFHQIALERHLDPRRYGPDLWYRGTGYIDFERFLRWIEEQKNLGTIDVQEGVIDAFKRYAYLRKLWEKLEKLPKADLTDRAKSRRRETASD